MGRRRVPAPPERIRPCIDRDRRRHPGCPCLWACPRALAPVTTRLGLPPLPSAAVTVPGLRLSSRARVLAAIVVVVVATVAMAGVVGAAPASAKSTTTTTAEVPAKVPTKWDPRLRPIADEVAKLRKLDFEHPVAAEFLDDATFEKKVTTDRGKLSKQDKRDLERSQAQLRAVGLIGADVDLFDAVGSLQTSGVLAYYDPKTKKI